MTEQGHNRPPYRTLDLTEEMHAFLLANAESNISFGLLVMQKMNETGASRETLEELIAAIEKFKELRKLLNDT